MKLNLARIEYYFAEFLSVMEMPNIKDWKIRYCSDTQPGRPKHLIGMVKDFESKTKRLVYWNAIKMIQLYNY